MPCFLPAVEMKPRTLWGCQATAFMISARVAPLARLISCRILAPLLSARGAVASLARGGLGGFLCGLGHFLRRGGLGLAALGAFLALGRALLAAGSLLRGGLLRRDGGTLFRNGGGGVGGGGFCVQSGHFRSISFCRSYYGDHIHHSAGAHKQVISAGIVFSVFSRRPACGAMPATRGSRP